MRAMLATALAAFAVTAAALPASASSFLSCGAVPQGQWLSIAEISAKAAALGYQVREIEIDDGCYEIHAIDRNGIRVEAYLHPVTAEVVRTKVDD